MELFQLVRREEHLHQTAAQRRIRAKTVTLPSTAPRASTGRCPPRRRRRSPGDLQRLAGDNGHQHLQKHHGRVGQRALGAVAVYPGAELFRLAGKADHGPPHEPGQRRRQQNEYDDGQHGQRFFSVVRSACASRAIPLFLVLPAGYHDFRKIMNETLRFAYKMSAPGFQGLHFTHEYAH